MTIIGIDLTAGARPSGYAALDDDGALLASGLVGDDEQITALVARHNAKLVAIDAPLGLPRGLCCLEVSCPCTPERTPGIRECELEARARGHALYHTTKRSIIRAMVYRGIALKRRLEAAGTRVIEVYPYASKRVLFAPRVPKKSTPEGLRWLAENVARVVISAPSLDDSVSHDELDAIVAAYTGLLFLRGRAIELGAPDEGTIVIPA